MLQVLYRKTTATVKVGGIQSNYFDIRQGVKQGCALSATLFNMFMEILIYALNKTGKGIKLADGRVIPAILYADDVMILAENHKDLMDLIAAYEDFCNSFRTTTNTDKTKYIIFKKRPRDMSKMYLADLSEDDSDEEIDRRAAKLKARKYARQRTKMNFYRKEIRVIEDHVPNSTSEIAAKKGDCFKVATRKPGRWATVMKEGEIGIFPEAKLDRVYLETVRSGGTEAHLFDDLDGLLLVDMVCKRLKRVAALTVVGVVFSWDMSEKPNREERLRKVNEKWAANSYAMTRSRFFSMDLWLNTWRSKVLTHMRYCEGASKNTKWDKGTAVNQRHLRWILGHQDKSTVAAIYDEAKVMSLAKMR